MSRDLEKFRSLLVALKQNILSEGDLAVKIEKSDPTPAMPDEDAQPLNEMNQVIASNRNKNRAADLSRINAALARLHNDPEDYGLCRDCGEDIPSKRLELMPFVELCAPCQQAKDKANKPAGRRHLLDYK